MTRDFWKAGHPPTLLAAFLYFDVAFMVWVMLGPLGVQIAETLGLNAAQRGMMVATPVFAAGKLTARRNGAYGPRFRHSRATC